MQRPKRNRKPESDIENGADTRHNKYKPMQQSEQEAEHGRRKTNNGRGLRQVRN